MNQGSMQRMPWRRWAAALAVAIASCGGPWGAVEAAVPSRAAADPTIQDVQVGASAFTKGGPIPAWVEPVPIPSTQATAPVVLRLADTQIRVDPVVTHYVNRAIQVNDSGALGQIGQYAIQFVPQYQHLTLHRLRLLRGGESIDVLERSSVRFIQREAALESGIFSGTVTALILIPDVRVGDTLHVSYTEEGRNPVFGAKYADAASWDQPEPAELRQVILRYPKQRPIAWRMVGDVSRPPVQPIQTEQDGQRVLTFAERNLPAHEAEPFVPAGYLPYRYLQFSEWGQWARVSRWATDLFPPVTPRSPTLQALIARLRSLPSDEARVAAALQWVQTEIRYFSVSLGESSHRPHSPDEVVDKRFGDCKDKTYLLLTLMQQLGLDARPVLLSLSARDGVHKLMPAPDVFDHVILQVRLPSGLHYLDGTRQRQTGALAHLGLGLEGFDALLVEPQTRALTSISSPTARANSLNELNETILIDALQGPATLSVKQVWHGMAAEAVRAFVAQSSPEQRRKFALNGYERRYPGVALQGEPVFADDAQSNELTMSATCLVPKMLMEVNGEWGLRYFPSNLQGVFNIPENIRRQHPVALFTQPYDARYHLIVNWPETVKVMRDPSVQKVQSVAFEAEVSTGFRGNKAQQIIEFHTRRGELKPDELPTFLEDLRRMEKAVDGLVYVERDAIAGAADHAGQTPAAPVTLQESIRTRLSQRVAKLSKTIESGKLSEDDLASALCDRAESLADLGRPEEGLADAERAVSKAPDLARAWACRANLRFALGQFGPSVADHSKALALGYDEFETYYHRGVARYYLGKLADAAGDFNRAVAAAPQDSARRYASLWWTWTAQRLKQPVPSPVAQLQAPAGGAWPWPAQALLLGRQTEDEVLAFVNGKSGDDRQLALAEAWFYIGQNQLMQGRPEQARASFEKAREQGVTVYLEHVAAGFELQRMRK